MRKELLFAIIAGLILGLIIAFGIWRVNKTMTPSNGSQSQTSNASPTPNAGFSITLANVEDLDVITVSPFKISGITKPNIKIAISAEEKDYILDSQKDGSFEKEVALIAGLNEIVIKAFDQNGESAELKLKVVFSSEFAKLIEETNTSENIATDEADSVRLKVEEKLANASKKPKAYIGTITDISKLTYQIKNLKGEIQQLSFTADTTFVKVDKTAKTITSNDVAIGDSIIAMGLKNGNEVLEAKRILVTEIPQDSLRNIYFGKIIDTTKTDVTISQIGSQEKLVTSVDKNTDYILMNDSKTSVIKLADLDNDEIVYVFGAKVNNDFEGRTIYLIEISESPSPSSTPTASPKTSISPTQSPK